MIRSKTELKKQILRNSRILTAVSLITFISLFTLLFSYGGGPDPFGILGILILLPVVLFMLFASRGISNYNLDAAIAASMGFFVSLINPLSIAISEARNNGLNQDFFLSILLTLPFLLAFYFSLQCIFLIRQYKIIDPQGLAKHQTGPLKYISKVAYVVIGVIVVLYILSAFLLPVLFFIKDML